MNLTTPKLLSWEYVNTGTGQILRTKPGQCSPGWAYDSASQHVSRMNCKRRLCPVCGWYWRHKWRRALLEKDEVSKFTGKIEPKLALTLTTAQATDYTQMWHCLRYFWRFMRRGFPKLEYWGTVEVNQKHSLIHLHFLLAGYEFIEFEYVRHCWMKAQEWAKFDKIAWDERIEEIKKNAAAYFTKYITKATAGNKDEIPTKEDWQGRHIRYSKGFFGVPVAAMAAAAKVKADFASGEQLARLGFHTFRPLASLSGFIEGWDKSHSQIDGLVNRPWYPIRPPGCVKVTLDIYDISQYNQERMPLADKALLLSLTSTL